MTRILLAGLYHATNTFVTEVTGADRFAILRGNQILECAGDGSPIDGFLEVAAEQRWTVVPAISVTATPSGPVADAVFDYFWTEMKSALDAALPAGLDAIYLNLRGAMVTQSLEDPEGTLLERIRVLPGGAAIRIFGVFDLHASFSETMAGHANCLVAYRENPHVDARLAGVRVARLLA